MIPMTDVTNPGQIVILNGAPRSGKSSIVAVIQDTFDGPWMNLGVDVFVREVTPKRYRPGMGLRPGEERHELAPLVPVLYAALYDSIAAHSRSGLNVVVDVGHHDPAILAESARRLAGLPVLFVGVRCPIEVVMERRNAGQVGREGEYAIGSTAEPIPPPVLRWQNAVHVPGIYDVEVDTSVQSPEECAAAIRRRLAEGPPPSAFRRLAEGDGTPPI
jgi:chloramphenicol 3-O phosphotransferase